MKRASSPGRRGGFPSATRTAGDRRRKTYSHGEPGSEGRRCSTRHLPSAERHAVQLQAQHEQREQSTTNLAACQLQRLVRQDVKLSARNREKIPSPRPLQPAKTQQPRDRSATLQQARRRGPPGHTVTVSRRRHLPTPEQPFRWRKQHPIFTI